MKYLTIPAILLALFAIKYTYDVQKQNYNLALGASVLSTASSDTLETFRTNVNSSLASLNTQFSSGIATSSTLTASQALYATGAATFAGVATSTLSLSSGFSYTGTLGYFLNGSSGTLKQVLNENHSLIATSTGGLLVGTSSVPIGVGYGQVLNNVRCFTNTGTVNVRIGYGTASTTEFVASTTIGTVTLSTNNTMTDGVKMVMDVGTPVSSAGKLVCTLNSTL